MVYPFNPTIKVKDGRTVTYLNALLMLSIVLRISSESRTSFLPLVHANGVVF